MSTVTRVFGWMMAAVPLLLAGCTVFQQDSDKALIREPGHRTYTRPPVDVSEWARAAWEYAVLSENVYIGEWKKQRQAPPQAARVLELPEATPQAYEDLCVPEPRQPLPLREWTMWENFPSPGLIQEALRVGLFMEVWEKKSSPAVIAVVFRGTEFSSVKDWASNLRWFLRFIPFHEDQYTLVSKRVGLEFVDRLADRRPDLRSADTQAVRIVAAGHSLGAGLAQHFAYSMPPRSRGGTPLPRVSSVYAFNPSPVTGWSSVDTDLRASNAAGLWIDRAFEHGEILAYVRLLLSYANPPSAAHPSIREVRYNFVRSANPLSSHSMRFLACALINAGGQARLPRLLERFGVTH